MQRGHHGVGNCHAYVGPDQRRSEHSDGQLYRKSTEGDAGWKGFLWNFFGECKEEEEAGCVYTRHGSKCLAAACEYNTIRYDVGAGYAQRIRRHMLRAVRAATYERKAEGNIESFVPKNIVTVYYHCVVAYRPSMFRLRVTDGMIEPSISHHSMNALFRAIAKPLLSTLFLMLKRPDTMLGRERLQISYPHCLFTFSSTIDVLTAAWEIAITTLVMTPRILPPSRPDLS